MEGIGGNVTDKRTILFRSGLLYPNDVTLKAPIRFFTNSTAQRFRITVTGFAEDGTPVSMQKEIEKQEQKSDGPGVEETVVSYVTVPGKLQAHSKIQIKLLLFF